jgi:hypothetical protein
MQDAQVIELFRALAVLEGVYYTLQGEIEKTPTAAVVRYTEECTWMKCTDCDKAGCGDRYVDDVMDRVRSYDEETPAAKTCALHGSELCGECMEDTADYGENGVVCPCETEPPTADEAFLTEGQRVIIPPPDDPHYEPLDMDLIQTQGAIANHLREARSERLAEETPAAEVGCSTRCQYQTPKHRCMVLRGGRMCWNPGAQCEQYKPLPR